jgi:MoxR-like ATPase
VSCEDIRALAKPVLRHRIIPSFAAEAEGLRADDIVDRLLKDVRE